MHGTTVKIKYYNVVGTVHIYEVAVHRTVEHYAITYTVKLYLQSQTTLRHISLAATTVISEDNTTHKYIHVKRDTNSSVLNGGHRI
jgi:hypothetical protein